MSDSKSKNQADNFSTRDPLGEIKSRAKELWAEDGKPKNRDWLTYVDEAETQLLSGVSAGIPSGRTRVPITASSCAPEIKALREQTANSFLNILAWSFEHQLDNHEAFCLTHILKHNKVKLPGTQHSSMLTPAMIAETLAVLAKEYDQSFLEEHKKDSLNAIPLNDRTKYWESKIADWESRDEALTYADRNTIARLTEAITKISSAS